MNHDLRQIKAFPEPSPTTNLGAMTESKTDSPSSSRVGIQDVNILRGQRITHAIKGAGFNRLARESNLGSKTRKFFSIQSIAFISGFTFREFGIKYRTLKFLSLHHLRMWLCDSPMGFSQSLARCSRSHETWAAGR